MDELRGEYAIPEFYFVCGGNAQWVASDTFTWMNAPILRSGRIQWSEAGPVDMDRIETELAEYLKSALVPWLQVVAHYQAAQSKMGMWRYVELVAQAFHAPIGKIEMTDVHGIWGVRFTLGGHDFVVYESTDDQGHLGVDVTCGYKSDHQACEGQYEILTDGAGYDPGRKSDEIVVAWLRKVVGEFIATNRMSCEQVPWPSE